MKVDIEQLNLGMKYLDDKGNSYVYQAINKVNQIDSISFSNFKFSIGSYSTDINKYFAEIARIKSNLIDLNEIEFGLMTNASETYNYILKINGEGDYNNELNNEFINNTSGIPMALTKDRIILLTYNLFKGTFGQTEKEQIEYFKNKLGYGLDVYSLIMSNLILQKKSADKINSAYDISINVDVPQFVETDVVNPFVMANNQTLDEYLVSLNNNNGFIYFSDGKFYLPSASFNGSESVRGSAPEGYNKVFFERLISMLNALSAEKGNYLTYGTEDENRAFRSIDVQTLMAQKIENKGMINPPGTSLHGWGLASDLRKKDDSVSDLQYSEAIKWCKENASDYGLSFPFENEGWHVQIPENDIVYFDE